MFGNVTTSTGVTVRREKALDFSGCNSCPGTGLHARRKCLRWMPCPLPS